MRERQIAIAIRKGLTIIRRAIIGAVAGLALVGFAIFFGLLSFSPSAAGETSKVVVVATWAIGFAILAVVQGDAIIPGRLASTIQGALLGTLIGLMIGDAVFKLDWSKGAGKFVDFAGILLGAVMGAVVGGILGSYLFSPMKDEASGKAGKPHPKDWAGTLEK